MNLKIIFPDKCLVTSWAGKRLSICGILILLGWPHTSSVNRTPMLFCTGWAYNILTKRKFVGISMLLHPIKRKFAKGHFKGPKRSSVQFFIKVVPT